ncbi:MAG: hypothetical protein HPY54_06260 [Chthonomonadetes bacterium]|nr:hypothetical protein [Chthonomonadetes bacterium]
MGKSKEISLPAAIGIIVVAAVLIIAIGWYLMNRSANPAPPPPPSGPIQTTAPVQTPKGAVQGQTGAATEY